jgi:hypothetical protein
LNSQNKLAIDKSRGGGGEGREKKLI